MKQQEIRQRVPNLEHVRERDRLEIAEMFMRLGFNEQLEVTDEQGTYLIHRENYERKTGKNQKNNGRS